MVSQCANPDCRRELHYLRDGKVYQFVLFRKTGGTYGDVDIEGDVEALFSSGAFPCEVKVQLGPTVSPGSPFAGNA